MTSRRLKPTAMIAHQFIAVAFKQRLKRRLRIKSAMTPQQKKRSLKYLFTRKNCIFAVNLKARSYGSNIFQSHAVTFIAYVFAQQKRGKFI